MMNLDEILQPGKTLTIFYKEGNINNRTVYIRGVVDEDWIAFKSWSPRKGWQYQIVQRGYFQVLLDGGRIQRVE